MRDSLMIQAHCRNYTRKDWAFAERGILRCIETSCPAMPILQRPHRRSPRNRPLGANTISKTPAETRQQARAIVHSTACSSGMTGKLPAALISTLLDSTSWTSCGGLCGVQFAEPGYELLDVRYKRDAHMKPPLVTIFSCAEPDLQLACRRISRPYRVAGWSV